MLTFTGSSDSRIRHIGRILAYRMCLELPQTAVSTAVVTDVEPFAKGFDKNLSDQVVDAIRTQASFVQRVAVLRELSTFLNSGIRMCIDVLPHISMLFPAYDWRLLNADELQTYLKEHDGCDFCIPGILDVMLVGTAIEPGRDKLRIWFCENQPAESMAYHFTSSLPEIAMPPDVSAAA